MREDRPKDAVQDFEGALEDMPNNASLVQYLAQAKWQADDREGSVASLRTWLDAHPTDVQMHYQLANYYLILNRSDEARLGFSKVIELDADNVLALNNLAWLRRDDDPAKALAYAERAVGLAPDSAIILDTYGEILLEQGQLAHALEVLRDASRKAPANLDIRYHFAKALARTGGKSEAVKVLENVLATGQPFKSRQQAESLLTRLAE